MSDLIQELERSPVRRLRYQAYISKLMRSASEAEAAPMSLVCQVHDKTFAIEGRQVAFMSRLSPDQVQISPRMPGDGFTLIDGEEVFLLHAKRLLDVSEPMRITKSTRVLMPKNRTGVRTFAYVIDAFLRSVRTDELDGIPVLDLNRK